MHQAFARQERSVMSRTAPSPARSNKIKALLAGGLVLGVGAAVTLASWTDQAYVDATFGTSSFNIQVDTAEGAEPWIEAETPDDARTLAFSVGFDALEPGDTVYAPVSLRTDPDGSVGGTVTLGSATPGAEADQVLFDALPTPSPRSPRAGHATRTRRATRSSTAPSAPAPTSTRSHSARTARTRPTSASQ